MGSRLLPSVERRRHCPSCRAPDFSCTFACHQLWALGTCLISQDLICRAEGLDCLILEGPFGPKLLWNQYTEEMWSSYFLISWCLDAQHFWQFLWHRDIEVKWLAHNHRTSPWNSEATLQCFLNFCLASHDYKRIKSHIRVESGWQMMDGAWSLVAFVMWVSDCLVFTQLHYPPLTSARLESSLFL